MLSKADLNGFKSNYQYLMQKALAHLIDKEWVHEIDRNVRIQTPIINENEVHFELIQLMIGKLLHTKTMTWEEINELD